MLEVGNVSVFYGRHRAVENVSMKIAVGEIVVMLGANGAGKSTLLRAIAGLSAGRAGRPKVTMDGLPTFPAVRPTILSKLASRWCRRIAEFSPI